MLACAEDFHMKTSASSAKIPRGNKRNVVIPAKSFPSKAHDAIAVYLLSG